MKKSPLPYLKHILDEVNYLISRTQSLKKERFAEGEDLQRAFVRSLEIMGETAKKVPMDFREKYNHVDWKGMAGMRDRRIHEYDTVDYEEVWNVVTEEVPLDKQQIEKIIAAKADSNE